MSIITEDFVFIHLRKAGGTTMRHLIYDAALGFRPEDLSDYWTDYRDSREIPSELRDYPWIKFNHPDNKNAGHDTVKQIPEPYQHLPVIGTIRNPFTWYVSWYNYWKPDDPKRHEHAQKINRAASFEEFILENPKFYTREVKRVYGNDHSNIHFVSTENQTEDFIRALSEIRGEELDPNLEELLRSEERRNVSKKRDKPYREYYNDRMIQFVLEKDVWTFDRFYPDREFPEE